MATNQSATKERAPRGSVFGSFITAATAQEAFAAADEHVTATAQDAAAAPGAP